MTNCIPVIVKYMDTYFPISSTLEGFLLYHDGINSYYVTADGIAIGEDPFGEENVVHKANAEVSATMLVPFKEESTLRFLLSEVYNFLQVKIALLRTKLVVVPAY